MQPQTLLARTSYFKGNRFLERARREGARVILLTVESLREAPWSRDALDDLFVMRNFSDLAEVIRGVAFLMRSRRIDRVVALDDYDVDVGASLREHFRLPGVGASAARFFRDKLAMRGLILRSPSSVRIDSLLADSTARIARDFQAVLPPANTATA